jgi:hypothetical protein
MVHARCAGASAAPQVRIRSFYPLPSDPAATGRRLFQGAGTLVVETSVWFGGDADGGVAQRLLRDLRDAPSAVFAQVHGWRGRRGGRVVRGGIQYVVVFVGWGGGGEGWASVAGRVCCGFTPSRTNIPAALQLHSVHACLPVCFPGSVGRGDHRARDCPGVCGPMRPPRLPRPPVCLRRC